MTREDIEKNPRLSPLAKLVAEYLSRRPQRVTLARELGAALGTVDGDCAATADSLRRAGIVCKTHEGQPLPLASFILTDDARAAYGVDSKKGKTA